MHALAVHVAPILAAEKSKVPFYIAGGLLVVWALVLSLGVGLRKDDFPATKQLERAVIAITAVLVIAAASTAVITSQSPSHEVPVSSGTKIPPTAPPPVVGAPVVVANSSAAPAPAQTPPSTPAKPSTPTATTGTPAPPSSPASVKTLTLLALAANPTGLLSYNTKQLSAKAGAVTITLTNSSPVEHDVAIAQGSKVVGATPMFVGGSKTLKLQLKPGTYTFYCTVPGHRQAGMEGTLTVS